MEEFRKDFNFSFPITGCPYFSQFGVKGLVELALYVDFVGAVSGSDFEVPGAISRVFRRWWNGDGVGLEREDKGEDYQSERERKKKKVIGYFHAVCMRLQSSTSVCLWVWVWSRGREERLRLLGREREIFFLHQYNISGSKT